MKHLTKEDLQKLLGIIVSPQFAVSGAEAKSLVELQERLSAEVNDSSPPPQSP